MNTLCLQPCMGASNEGPSSAGQPCIFNTTRGMITGLERDAWYEFYVFAGNTAGTGLASDPLWMKTEALPKPVTGLNVSQVDVDRVRLVWNQMDPSLCTGGQNGNCTYKVPIVGKTINIKMPDCPIKAGSIVNSTHVTLPSKSPLPLKIEAKGTITLKNGDGSTLALVEIDATVQ